MSLSAQAEAQRHAKVRVSQQYIFIRGDHWVGWGWNAFPLIALDSRGMAGQRKRNLRKRMESGSDLP